MIIMDSFLQMQYDICASLWLMPGTIQDLSRRDFLHNKSDYGIDRCLQQLERKKLIYEKDSKLYCYKKTVKKLNELGYELNL